jgi:hypothetical protein
MISDLKSCPSCNPEIVFKLLLSVEEERMRYSFKAVCVLYVISKKVIAPGQQRIQYY